MAAIWPARPPSAADTKPATASMAAAPYARMRVRLGTASRYRGAVWRPLALLLLAALPAGCGGGGDKPSEPLPDVARSITVTSPAFRDGGAIPRRFSCDGNGSSPALRWSGVPGRAIELTLVVEDPDADRFVHWTVLQIAGDQTGLRDGRVPAGAVETENSFGKPGWGAPCPPKGDDPHRYVFALYATDAPLRLGKDSSPDEVRAALSDHAVARGTLTGRFGR
jgi:Raf kinase inhibitor-like YbhB/YbcL family protein